MNDNKDRVALVKMVHKIVIILNSFILFVAGMLAANIVFASYKISVKKTEAPPVYEEPVTEREFHKSLEYLDK